MQHFAFVVTTLSLLTFLSFAFASPLPVQFIKEMREPTVALDARGALAGRDALHRKASAFAESGAGLDILVLEYEMFEGVISGEDATRDTHELEPRARCEVFECF